MDVRELGALALVIVVASIIISMGASILGSLALNQCSSLSGTWVEVGYADASHLNTTPINTVTGAKYGCCATAINVSNDCTAWSDNEGLAVTGQGTAGMVTFGNWIPLIALVIAASIVIGVIVKYLGGTAGGV